MPGNRMTPYRVSSRNVGQFYAEYLILASPSIS